MWLGYNNARITAALRDQLERVWNTGALKNPSTQIAAERLGSLFPRSHRLAGFCSTGMEAAEFAVRIARVATGRLGVVGFAGAMHGKSLLASSLAWDNGDGVSIPFVHRLPFVDQSSEEEVLDTLAQTLAHHSISAVFVEPVHATGGGHTASDNFYREVVHQTRAAGALVVFDEILTGLHRLGPQFAYQTLLPGRTMPDIVLVGKALGNGFPVAAVVARRAIRIEPAMLSGSTFAGNPLACAVVSATLDELGELAVPARLDPLARIDHRFGI